MPSPILETRNLCLSRNATRVLEDITIRINTGETLVVIGRSGGGKSSLLRCLNRLEEPDSGQILFNAADITTLPVTDLRRKVGFVFQKTAVFDGTVADNIAFGARLVGQDLPSERIRDLLEMVTLDPALIDKDARQLSGGQEQRLAIARALANNPQVLLLDEPTSALDPIASKQIEDLMMRLKHELGLTLVWVSHSPDQARRVADRVLLLEAGRVVRTDSVDAMLDPEHGDSRALSFAAGYQTDIYEDMP